MISRKLRLKMLLTCTLVFSALGGSILVAQSASDPLSNDPAVVEPATPENPESGVVVLPVNPDAGQLVPHEDVPPAWFSSFLDMVSAIPSVGNALAIVINWMGALAAILTALASVLLAIKTTLMKMGKVMPYADKLIKWIEMVYPYVAWLSMYNVQKPKKP
jgi:hypothetical protein